jgi:hypothetical protein
MVPGADMVQRVSTVSFEGIEVRAVDVQVQVAPGLPAFTIVGLPDKAVSEARERVRSALIASGLALPARRITINLAPADLPKEGSHYDLPIALGLMAAIRRLWRNQSGKRRCVVIMRERNGSSLPFVCRSEELSLPVIQDRVKPGSVVYADEASCWDALHARYLTKRINHTVA